MLPRGTSSLLGEEGKSTGDAQENDCGGPSDVVLDASNSDPLVTCVDPDRSSDSPQSFRKIFRSTPSVQKDADDHLEIRRIFSKYGHKSLEHIYTGPGDDTDRFDIRLTPYISRLQFSESSYDIEQLDSRGHKGASEFPQIKSPVQALRFRPRFKSSSVDKWGRSFSVSKFESLSRSRVNMAYSPIPCFINSDMHAVLYDLEAKHILNPRTDTPTDFCALECYLRGKCFEDPDALIRRSNPNVYVAKDLLPKLKDEEKSARLALRYAGASAARYNESLTQFSRGNHDPSSGSVSDDASLDQRTVFSRSNSKFPSPMATSISKFVMIWSNPLYRLYIYMYLTGRNYENLYLFLHSVSRLKSAVLSDPIILRNLAPQIFSRYLRPDSPMYVGKCIPECKHFLAIMVRLVKNSIRSNRPNLFDDIYSLVYHYIFLICTYGFEGITASSNAMAEGLNFKVFEDSAEYQMLVSDYGLGRVPTTADIKRSVHRACVMRKDLAGNNELVSQMLCVLQDFCVIPASTFGSISNNFYPGHRLSHRSWSLLRSPSFQSQYSVGNVSDADKNSATNLSKSSAQLEIDSLKNILLSPGRSFKNQKYLHNFGDLNGTSDQVYLYCDHCLRRGSSGPYNDVECLCICNICGYIVHKYCRYLVVVPCFEGSRSYAVDLFCPDDLLPTGHDSCYKERMEAVLKEIEIERKIFEGFKSLIKARKDLVSKNARFKKKDEALKSMFEPHIAMHESKMLKLQEKARRCGLALATTKTEKDSIYSKDDDNHEGAKSGSEALISSLKQQIVIKSRYCDTKSGADIVKTLVINPDTKSKDVISHLIKKLYLDETEKSYVLVLADKSGSRVPLLPDEPIDKKISKDAEDYEIIIQKKNVGSSDVKTPNSGNEFECLQTLNELVESEYEYYNYLVLMRDLFMVPLKKNPNTKSVVDDIFVNIHELISLHENIVFTLKKLSCKTTNDISAVLEAYENSIPGFVAYQTYCLNQPNALKIIARLRSSKIGSAILSHHESSAKLCKQTLSDLIVKPMQRITRYPLFFRRLSPAVMEVKDLHKKIFDLITKFECTISLTNNLMMREDHNSALTQLDRDINFNGIFPHFSLLCASRELISTNSFHIIRKTRVLNTRADFYLMSDMLLVGRKKKSGYFTLITAPIMLETAIVSVKSAPDMESGYCVNIIDNNTDALCFRSKSYSETKSWINLFLTVQFIFRYDMWLYEHLRSAEIYKCVIESRAT